MMSQDLLAGIGRLLEAPAPRFIDDEASGGHVTELTKEAGAPAAADDLAWLESALAGSADSLLALYRRWDGMRLFADQHDMETCFYFLPISSMQAEKRQLESWMEIGSEQAHDYIEALDESGKQAFYGIPEWWQSAVVFAGFGYAPERFFIATEGVHRGRIFTHEHDGGYSIKVAENSDALLRQLGEDPAGFMRNNYGVGYHDVARYQPE